ncbi:anthranilate synthase component I [Planomicrobium sp. CPCC 101110]|uniref:anthranilate synthase component I n=1 Tax=Planomicrobium sp. CPCC 101110 TaxID=2599619 RepID=UPI0011B7D981|nr:anthranilate synthase component I [Planomicrobium sp. CPCC 101110]TWT24870.1 anthranilate synthase component I [Planomicrobium sp. CPCC 101110]
MKMRKINGDSLTPIAVFNRLTGSRKCLLESSLKTTASGRYSFIGADPSKSFIGTGNSLTEMDYRTGSKTEFAGKPLELLKSRMPAYEAQVEGLPFTGGALGYIGYDAIQAYEPVDAPRKNSLEMPDLHLHLYETIVVFDHMKNDVTILSFEDKVDQIEKELSLPEQTANFEEQQPLQFQSETDAAKFRAQVEQAKDHIRKGDVFQLVLSQRLSATYKGDAFTLYRKLRKQNPSPYQFFVEFDDYSVVGASPESLLTIRNGQMVTNPIAGTRKRGKTEAEDNMLATELANDEKERAEHQMLVDLSRNDVGRVAEIGSVAIPKFMAIEKYQHVMHLVSEVTGQLNQAMHPLDALVSCLPAGTVSGAPKVRAMQLIQQFEEDRRGVYGGAIGYLGFNGNLDVALAIRTFVMKGEQVHVQAGAGIVYDSDPQAEYEETLHKARSLTEVFG